MTRRSADRSWVTMSGHTDEQGVFVEHRVTLRVHVAVFDTGAYFSGCGVNRAYYENLDALERDFGACGRIQLDYHANKRVQECVDELR